MEEQVYITNGSIKIVYAFLVKIKLLEKKFHTKVDIYKD